MKLITTGFALALVAFIILIDCGIRMPFVQFVYSLPGGDKAGHFLLMGVLSFLVNMTLSVHRTKIFNYSILSGSSMIAFVVTLEEISQLFIKGRTFSLFDLFFDYVGIVIFGWFAYYLVAKISIGQSRAKNVTGELKQQIP